MLHRLIADAELPQIEAHHLGLDLHLVELLARIDPNHRADHLGHDNHVSEMGFDEIGFLVGLRLLFRFAEFLDEAHGFAFEAAVEAAAGARVDYVAELFGGEVEESVWVSDGGGGWRWMGLGRREGRRTGRGRCRGRRICGRFSSS